ncbi:MAG: helix-turn-helix domain-containing protein [Eubacteriales bacterium]
MTTSHEIINYSTNLPLNLFVHTIGSVAKHWHQSLELLIVVKGSATVMVGNKTTELEKGDVFLINANQVHDLKGEQTVLIAIQIKPELMKNIPQEFKAIHYTCDSTRDEDPSRFEVIRYIVAKLIQLNLEGGKYIQLMNESLFYNLVYELYAGFADGENFNQDEALKHLSRLNQVLALINSEYDQRLTLEGIAERIYVSPQYLSKFFKQSMGISLTEHIKATRLSYATNDLLHLDNSIENVALSNGFPNTRAFVSAFKERYGVLPSVWRSQNISQTEKPMPKSKDKSINYYEGESDIANDALQKFLDEHLFGKFGITPVSQNSDISYSIEEHENINGEFKKFIGVSRAKDLLLSPVREQLREAQEQMHFDYIKMHSILDDDLFVYTQTPSGEPVYNFNLVDQVLDFLVSIKLKPLIQFSFMPLALAAHPERKMFSAGAIISEPKKMERWCELVDMFVRHISDRYSPEEIDLWLFSVWNEPSTANTMFGFDTDEAYYRLYTATYKTVKKISEHLRFGGPAGFSAYRKNDDWLLDFLAFADKNGVRPDFISVHYYDIDLSNEFFRNRQFTNDLWLSPVENSFTEHFKKLREQLSECGYPNEPLYVTEWNSTTSHKDLLSDTCFKSSYIVKNVIEALGQIDGLCYWLLTDLHEENQMPPTVFHGGLGMFTMTGIKKASYYAMQFLSRLGNKILFRDDGLIVTQKGENTVILLYNYHHYSKQYAQNIGIHVSYADRYTVFPSKGRKNVDITIPQLSGRFLVTEEYVNRHHGSSYDAFVKMGALEPLSEHDRDFLNSISVPQIKKHICEGSPLHLSITLSSFEIRLITIKKYNA